jgi:hypothetical protein
MTVPSRPSVKLAIVALVSAVGLALTGCVGIPTSGAVLTGTEIKTASVENGATYIPEGPAKGANQQQILQGFISAFASSQNNYSVAREFLGSGFKDNWDPRQSVLVRGTGGTSFDALGGDMLRYTIDTLAVVDSSGTYTRSPDPEVQSLTFQFAKQGGQWRITEAPQGIVLLESTFESIFSAQTLYFLDPSGKRLVPDQRWFPTGAQTVRIVSALLAGPSSALRGAVYTAFPEGTKLSSPLIPIQNAVAQIDLSVEALSSKSNDRQLMRQQLLASLGGVSSIAGVSISVGDSVLPIPDSGPDLPTDPQVDPRPLVLQKDSFGFSEGGRVSAISLSTKILALKPLAVTLSSSGTTAAVLSASGVVSMVAVSGDPISLDTRPGLVPPTMDEDGFVWSVPTNSPNAIRVFDAAGKGYDLSPALPADSSIVSLEVSRDGARVAMYLSTNAGPRIVVSAIVRSADQNQRPISLVADSILDATADSGTPIDATWVDGLSVATLSVVNGQPTVSLYRLGGSRTSLGRPEAATEIVGGNGGTAGLRLLGGDGSIQTLRGSSWISSNVQVGLLATQR